MRLLSKCYNLFIIDYHSCAIKQAESYSNFVSNERKLALTKLGRNSALPVMNSRWLDKHLVKYAAHFILTNQIKHAIHVNQSGAKPSQRWLGFRSLSRVWRWLHVIVSESWLVNCLESIDCNFIGVGSTSVLHHSNCSTTGCNLTFYWIGNMFPKICT